MNYKMFLLALCAALSVGAADQDPRIAGLNQALAHSRIDNSSTDDVLSLMRMKADPTNVNLDLVREVVGNRDFTSLQRLIDEGGYLFNGTVVSKELMEGVTFDTRDIVDSLVEARADINHLDPSLLFAVVNGKELRADDVPAIPMEERRGFSRNVERSRLENRCARIRIME